jgi:hypothetical protein
VLDDKVPTTRREVSSEDDESEEKSTSPGAGSVLGEPFDWHLVVMTSTGVLIGTGNGSSEG